MKESKPTVHGVCPKTLSLAISALLLSSAIQAEPSWECQLASDGGWECTTEGVAARERPSEPILPDQGQKKTSGESLQAPAASVGTGTLPKETAESATKSAPTTLKPADSEPFSSDSLQSRSTTNTESKTPPEVATTAEQSTSDAPRKTTTDSSLNLRIDQDLDWQSCRSPLLVSNPREMPQDDAIHILADAAVLRESTQDADFSGSVSITRGATLVEADKAHYDRQLELLDTQGNVFFERNNMRMTSDSATFNLATDQGHAEGIEY
ncbi:MAG: hypothetical protein GY934_12285, partial [Gammaproteobacteria bacterium]|nr:hypothetical protein [Gammaproteobacteria bacterium]